MRILIDEFLPARLKNSFVQLGHDCKTVQDVGITNKKNGELLCLADGEWDVLLTNDRNIKFQQNYDWAEHFRSRVAGEFKSVV